MAGYAPRVKSEGDVLSNIEEGSLILAGKLIDVSLFLEEDH